MALTFANPTGDIVPLFCVSGDMEPICPDELGTAAANWVKNSGYAARVGEICIIPGPDGKILAALVGMGNAQAKERGRFLFAAARPVLPLGTYHLAGGIAQEDLDEAALGWLLAGYQFKSYCGTVKPMAALVAPEGCDAQRLEIIAAGEALTRDLINTPANDMGPDALEAAAIALANKHGATISLTVGQDLVDQNFPMIHAVGRACDIAPRLISMTWGNAGPRITLVGKGVCFDTGGLNIKPGASMGLMKKDMGGAANVLGLAHMIMAAGLNVQLRVLIPAVENSISAGAFRPGDILTSRKGLTVEINNTDAEGRLVLADALALADEEGPDLIISMATLTGAARVAVGPDIAPYYASDDADAARFEAASQATKDPSWRMPFWAPYDTMIEPGIADLDNAPKGGFAGSITAALFLRRFVTQTPRYMHFDIYGWNPTPAPARPKGGVGQATRALLEMLERQS